MPEDLMVDYQKANRQFRHVAAQMSLYGPDTMRTAQIWSSTGTPEQKALGARYYANMNKRKLLCINNPNKVEIVEKIVSLCPDRYGIVFSQSVEFADSITNAIGDSAVTFHSKMSKKAQKEILGNFKDLESNTRIISSVQALDAGFDFVDLSLAIVAAGYSSQLTNTQRIGRTVRAKEGKDAIIINLYSLGTQEETWLEKRQKGTKGVQHVNVETLMTLLA
jgi:superfamily II DNA or RNA helicase